MIKAIINIALLIGGMLLIAPFTGGWVALGFGMLAMYSRPD